VRVPVLGLAAGLVVLDRDASRYVRDVRRLALGDRFVAFDPDARVEADAEIVGLELRGAVTARLDPPRPAPLLPSRPVTLVQCVGKSDKLDAVVRDATELGATEILTARSERTVASRDSDAALARYRRIALEAARQCGRGDLPRIAAPQPLVDVLRTIAAPIRVLLHPDGAARAARRGRCLAPVDRRRHRDRSRRGVLGAGARLGRGCRLRPRPPWLHDSPNRDRRDRGLGRAPRPRSAGAHDADVARPSG
jgi:16S rRNA U1498 N3-methylase RsmE